MNICRKNVDVQAMEWKHKLEQRENVFTKDIQGEILILLIVTFLIRQSLPTLQSPVNVTIVMNKHFQQLILHNFPLKVRFCP